MKSAIIVSSIVGGATAFNSLAPTAITFRKAGLALQMSNADMFGGPSSGSSSAAVVEPAVNTDYLSRQKQKYVSEAERLRQEAAEMEIALREEARAKGLPEELVNKLVPPPRASKPAVTVTSSATATTTESSTEESSYDATPAPAAAAPTKSLSISDVRVKLGYLNSGDAVRFTSELDRLKMKGVTRRWNSKDLGNKPNFAVSNGQLTTRTSIDPIKLRLDDVGYDYQKVFVTALALGTVLGLSSSAIGGETGFILGYLSALLPIALVGVGSVAPALIFEVLSRFKHATNKDAANRYAHMNAGKFLVGYVMGLPIARFDSGSPSNTAEFFQLRPTGRPEAEDRRMFSKKTFSQEDVARSTVTYIAGSVAECMSFGEASGSNPADVNTLNDILSRVEPALTTEKAQNHIRWSALTAHSILSENKDAYTRLVEAFKAGLPLEECIASIEGEGPLDIV